jgi:cytochrome oxidase Cu insertion factor (SCO1/SenC/PrrC family)
MYTGVIDVGFEAGSGKNKGELIHPARPLEDIVLVDTTGQKITRENFLGLWTMLEIAPATCVEDCMKNVYKMRQIRLALGKDAHRVQRVVIANDDTQLDKVMADNPGTHLYLTAAGSASLLQQFPDYAVGGISSIAQRIYIIDPLGNLMMRYPTNADPSDILKDLRQLLKVTWIRPKN